MKYYRHVPLIINMECIPLLIMQQPHDVYPKDVTNQPHNVYQFRQVADLAKPSTVSVMYK